MKLPWQKEKSVQYAPVNSGRGGWRILEAFTGAWQKNIEWDRQTVLSNPTVFACISLISSDISKLRPKYVKEVDGIWDSVPFGKYAFLNKPNNYQNRIQFFQAWVNSVLTRGNAYILKGRNESGQVNRLYVLHPDLVLPLVTDSGDVYYQLGQDNLTGISSTGITVPASEIIHDRINCLFHPLVGLSPLFACGCAAYLALKIQDNSSKHFINMSRPSGILTAPGAISDTTANLLKEHWETNYGGENYGKTAVLGDDLKYTPIAITAVESQLIEQLKWTAETIAATFHVPFYKVGGAYPSYNNVEALDTNYYSQCLQIYIESIEECLDQGLEVPDKTGFEFDLNGLLRMDGKSQVDTLAAAVKGGIDTPNEARRKRNQKPLEGGDTVYLQQQMYSMEALSKRDNMDNPFDTSSETDNNPPQPATTPDETEERTIAISSVMLKMMQNREKVDYAS